MSKMQALRKAIELFKHPHTEKRVQRHNQRQWLRSVGILGDNWVLARKFGKLPNVPKPTLHRQYAA